MGRVGSVGRWGDGEMGRWGDGEMGILGDALLLHKGRDWEFQCILANCLL
ncbi:hypothetical protein [Moorena producens]|nr:hypothetical protein [Moorena producens]